MIRHALIALAIAGVFSIPATCSAARPIDFGRDVMPILSDKCFHCHGPDESHREADLRLDVREHVFADRDGSRVVVPGKPRESSLLQRITSADTDERMPPKSQTRQLSKADIDVLQRWINEGAQWNQHWAFEKPRRPVAPSVSDASWLRNSIDGFVLSRLDREKLQPSPAARRETLIRRVTLDLTGLPPTLEEIDAFLADRSPNAYERVVDRLLTSPRYGEHMALPWLDATRYADTDGYQNDRIRYMWPWRDWVIRALNSGMPFDQFTVEQIAGDMLPNATFNQQLATGFGRSHRINSEGGSIPDEWAVEYVADRVETMGTIWLGLTIGCARCHKHKYDPVSHQDFYRLFAYFNNVPEWGLGPNNGNSPPFVDLPKSWPNLSAEEDRAITPKPYQLVTTQTSVVRPKPGGPGTVMIMHESKKSRPTYLLKRGQYDQPDKSARLQPAVPKSLGAIPAGEPNTRLGLARWLVDPSNPLTTRVIVNRYWQQFFGVGLVKTSENFGVQGEHPSHPQLLDWLATEFVRTGWNVKAMHRLIVTSATYRQSSAVSPSLLERDPENRLLARGSRRRLSGSVIRDQVLAMSGLLVEHQGGPSVKPYMPPGLWRSISNAKYVQDHGDKLYRRSLYTYWRRTVPPPTMMAFNAAEREVCIVRKEQTNSPLQALTMMNNITFIETSRLMAERMLREGGKSTEDKIAFGFRLATSRFPTNDESQILRDVHRQFTQRYRNDATAANALLGVGEFPHDSSLNAAELAAMTMLASTILNLDETITKE
jgi:hypothetical protein